MKDTPSPASNCRLYEIDRRAFLTAAAAGAVLASGAPAHLAAAPAKRNGNRPGEPETLVGQLYQSLSEEQRSEICFAFNHPLRSEIDNNWFITDAEVRDFTSDQQALIKEIFNKIHSPEYRGVVMDQVTQDAGRKGFGECSIALFGKPGTGRFEFVLTGRHVTRRCDGDSLEGAAFGGPIFYGHAARGFNESPDHEGNAYWYQALQANKVFDALDGKQRETALLKRGRPERAAKTVELTGKKTGLPGIPMTELSGDQKDLVREVIGDVLAPYREADVQESTRLIEQAGFDHLHMAFFKAGDIGNDGVWDVWQIEGPSMLMYFRGAPHVHAWIHIRDKAQA